MAFLVNEVSVPCHVPPLRRSGTIGKLHEWYISRYPCISVQRLLKTAVSGKLIVLGAMLMEMLERRTSDIVIPLEIT